MEKINHQIGVGSLIISDKGRKYVNEVLDNNRLSYGPFCQKFENLFAKLHQCKYSILSNSGTSALEIAVATLKEAENWKDGDEIIVPALTFVASINVILQNNLKPVFVDVDKKTYNIDPKKIEDKITEKTKGIMVVHLFGHPCDMDPIMELVKKYNLKMIEDSCETIFAKYKGKSVGSFGDISCFSTYACHIIQTGVGGLSLTNNEKYAVILRSLVNHGRNNIYLSMDDDKGKRDKELKMVMDKRFSFERRGYSYRITELEAALGLAQLEDIENIMKQRRKNAQFLSNSLKKWEEYIQLPTIMDGAEHSFMMFPIVIKTDKIKRDALTLFLEENNIETRHMLPLTNQPYLPKLFGEDIEDKHPVAKNINKNGFYIGCQVDLTEEELAYMVSKFDEFFTKFV